MSEPQAPAPPAAPPPEKKKVSPWVWVGVGCLALLLLVFGLMGACGMFVAKKAKEMAGEFEENPARAAAELVVRVNPDLELVESDDEAGTITVRQKSTGETFTADFDEIAEGRFSFETPEGESTISFGEEGGLKVTGPEGEATFGAGAGAELPAWIAAYPGASEPESSYSSEGTDERAGAVSFRTSDPVARVLEFYERSLKAAGMEVSKTTFTAQGSEGGMISASSRDPKRSASFMVSEDDGETTVAVNYSEATGGS